MSSVLGVRWMVPGLMVVALLGCSFAALAADAAPEAKAAVAPALENVKLTEKIALASGSLEVVVCSKTADEETAKMLVDELSSFLKEKSLPGDMHLVVTIEKVDAGATNTMLGQSLWWQEWKAMCTLTDAASKGENKLESCEIKARGEAAVQMESTVRAMRDVAMQVKDAALKATAQE